MIQPESVRFLAKVDTLSSERGCWAWTGAKSGDGYGRFRAGQPANTLVAAHRWAYEFFIGPVPEGLVLDHLCRNPRCVNPQHLEPVTVGENTRRGLALVLSAKVNTDKTVCPAGHPYDEINTYRPPGNPNHRMCRICRADRSRQRSAAATARTRNTSTEGAA